MNILFYDINICDFKVNFNGNGNGNGNGKK